MRTNFTTKVRAKSGKTYHAYMVDGKTVPRHLVPAATHLREAFSASAERVRGALATLGMSEHADSVVAYALATFAKTPAKPGPVRNDVSAKVAGDLKSLGLDMTEEEKHE